MKTIKNVFLFFLLLSVIALGFFINEHAQDGLLPFVALVVVPFITYLVLRFFTSRGSTYSIHR